MFNLLIGFAAAAVLYTFFPTLAVTPSNWLRAAWAWIGRIGTRKDAE